ncbi:MAG: PD-(D/E)XK nuclease family protein, partial [Bacteroidota bacterium]
QNTPKGISNLFLKEKRIQVVGVPKAISQAKYAGKIIENEMGAAPQKSIALVLGDEGLLPAVLQSLPPKDIDINVTMGLPLQKTSLYSFFQSFFELQRNKTPQGWYYKDVERMLSNPFTRELLSPDQGLAASKLSNTIKDLNLLYLEASFLESPTFNQVEPFQAIFQDIPLDALSCLKNLQTLTAMLQEALEQSKKHFELQVLHAFSRLLNNIYDYLLAKPYIKHLKGLIALFQELIGTEQIDFKGSPIGGLQIMGVLESRNLDFETVIVTTVNEGVLPSGKGAPSFIPYTIKKDFGLHTNKEKDAVYAYHFYRLLQRAKSVYLLYNTEPDVLMGNERSRFIPQLLTDNNIKTNVTHKVVTPNVAFPPLVERSVQKTPLLIDSLKAMALKGFSPSALTTYLRNPYTFYKNYILQLKDIEAVEEYIAPNTLGTVIHDSLEELYLPLIGKLLTPDDLKPLKNKVKTVTNRNFQKFYPKTALGRGHTLIASEVTQKYITSFIDFDMKRCQLQTITLIALEQSYRTKLDLPEFDFPIYLKGKLDRLEMVDGIHQVLDYKTGSVRPTEVHIPSLDDLTTNPQRSKALQLLCYALMVADSSQEIPTLKAGIIPLKQIKSGILHFSIKAGKQPKNQLIDQELRNQFKDKLGQLFTEIFNPSITFMDMESAVL